MAKGFYSQGVAILLSEDVSINNIKEVLEKEFEIAKVHEEASDWVFSGPSIVIPYRPEVNGYVIVDIVNRPWPDDMGDPKEDAMLFGAWSMGQFGPFTFPGGLQRAVQQAWNYADEEGKVENHKAFIRIRTSYVLGKIDNNAPILPKDYEALSELIFILKISEILLDMPEALCYFNPNGECLALGETIDSLMERHAKIGLPPFEVIANIRLYKLPQNEDWMLMDTVGMMQLDISDQEAIFHKDSYDPNEVGNFLRNSTNYVFTNGPIIKNGDTMDGPGGIPWQGATFEDEIASPPRQVLRWFPMDNRERPYGLQGEDENDDENIQEIKTDNAEVKDKKKGFFSKLFGK